MWDFLYLWDVLFAIIADINSSHLIRNLQYLIHVLWTGYLYEANFRVHEFFFRNNRTQYKIFTYQICSNSILNVGYQNLVQENCLPFLCPEIRRPYMDHHREHWSSKSTPQTPEKWLFDTDVKCVPVHLRQKNVCI